jgi:hypothetical protein
MRGLKRLLEAMVPKGGDWEWMDSRMERKPSSWSDLDRATDYQVDLSKAPAAVLNFVQGLKKVGSDVAYDNPAGATPNTDFDAAVPQWFILDRGGRKFYLVNTGGYKYPRYCGRLIGMEKL